MNFTYKKTIGAKHTICSYAEWNSMRYSEDIVLYFGKLSD